jgi:hypothetical protein
LNGAKDRSKTFIKSVQLKNKKRGLWVEASHPYFSVVYVRLILKHTHTQFVVIVFV